MSEGTQTIIKKYFSSFFENFERGPEFGFDFFFFLSRRTKKIGLWLSSLDGQHGACVLPSSFTQDSVVWELSFPKVNLQAAVTMCHFLVHAVLFVNELFMLQHRSRPALNISQATNGFYWFAFS